MKKMIVLAALTMTVTAAFAAETKKEETPAAKAPEALQPQAAAAAAQGPKKKTTDVSFEDVLVQGKYHFSDEAVTTVEQDKILDALLGVRQDFKDRLKKSAARH